MLNHNYGSQDNLSRNSQRDNRYNNIHKNFVLPQDNFYGESSYQNSYAKKDVNYNDLRAVIEKPKQTVENKHFEGVSSYNDSYGYSKNFNGKPQKFKQPDNIQLSNEPFNGSSEYNSQLKGQAQSTRTERYPLPRNEIFPKGQFEGISNYNNTYVQNEIRRQPQFRPQGELKIGNDRFQGVSSYLNDYSNNKQIQKVEKITQKNNEVIPRGNFSGQSTYLNSYVGSQVQRSRKFVPQSELKVGGKFQGQSSYENQFNQKMIERTQKYVMPQNQTLPRGRFEGKSNYNDSYTGPPAQKQKQIRPEEEWKMEGQFEGNSSYLNDYQRYENAKRSSMKPLKDNRFMPEGQFQSSTSYQDSYVPNQAVRERQFRPEGQLRVGGQHFQGNSSYVSDYSGRDQVPVAEKIIPKENDILPRGRFQGQSAYHENYIPTMVEKSQSFRPRGQLEVGGKFQGTSNYMQQFNEKKGLRSERVPLPLNQVMPEGRFDGQSNYTNSYIPTAIEKTQRVVMKPELKVGQGKFEGNTTYAENYQYSPIKDIRDLNMGNYNEQYAQEIKQPRWNKKLSRWE